jgi:hypothetical protein
VKGFSVGALAFVLRMLNYKIFSKMHSHENNGHFKFKHTRRNMKFHPLPRHDLAIHCKWFPPRSTLYNDNLITKLLFQHELFIIIAALAPVPLAGAIELRNCSG